MMTRKDFQFIADKIAEMPDKNTRVIVAKIFADILQELNPNFDRDRFFAAANAKQ